MTQNQISWLGEVAAKAAVRAIKNGDRAGSDQNRGQFVELVKDALETIPAETRGEEACSFLTQYARGAYVPNTQ